MDRVSPRLRAIGPTIAAALAALATVAALAWVGGTIAERRETDRQSDQLRTDLLLRRELLRSELERHRLLPAVLAEDRTLSDALARRTDAEGRNDVIARLNPRFAALALRDGAATLYLIGADGVTVASSNHDSATSFVGKDYSFRPYFRDAMTRGSGEFFAQGTVSGIPGLYLAQRLWDRSGVVVVKVEFGALERNWRAGGEQTFVTDAAGTVLITSDPGLRVSRDPVAARPAADLLRITTEATQPGWTLVATRDIRRGRLTARALGWTTGGLAGALLCLGLGLLWVVRSRAESRVQQLRADLMQANRLAVLGQISAGVAHEINQPVAAIRGHVDNAAVLLRRGDAAAVERSLGSVAALTDRIGLITNELRLFSRKSDAAPETLRVGDAIDGALLLLDALAKSQRVRIQREEPADAVTVVAHRVRLEQVLVNLLQNALEALQDRPAPLIRIRVQREDATGAVSIRICDNGPGVAPAQLAQLFMPFSTSKPLGLGLGLVICKDLLAEYGATLSHERSEHGGASFVVRFPAVRA
jgi:two-component system C4-dicarboxylate transport sensor histidine kinase DctB